jgi:uncharacterized membrane protein HdeD (DUF308 family)
MEKLVKRSWWVLALMGAVSVLFGILALVWPGLTLLWLVALFAAYAIISGGFAIIGAIRNRRVDDDWWLMLLLGIVSLAAGIIAVFHPDLTALVLVLLMGANAIVTGILEIVMAVRLRKAIRGEWLLGLAGVVSIAFGVLVFLFPGAGALALVWLVSLYAIMTGVLLFSLAWRARKSTDRRWQGMPPGQPTPA